MSEGEFSVYLFFPDGSSYAEERFIDPESAVKTARRIIYSVGGRLGLVKRVIITDGGDCIAFEWIHGQGMILR